MSEMYTNRAKSSGQVYRSSPKGRQAARRQTASEPRAKRQDGHGPMEHTVMVICYNRRNLSGLLLLSMMAQICANAHEAWMHFV